MALLAELSRRRWLKTHIAAIIAMWAAIGAALAAVLPASSAPPAIRAACLISWKRSLIPKAWNRAATQAVARERNVPSTIALLDMRGRPTLARIRLRNGLSQDRRAKSGIARSADRAAIAREAGFVASPRVRRRFESP